MSNKNISDKSVCWQRHKASYFSGGASPIDSSSRLMGTPEALKGPETRRECRRRERRLRMKTKNIGIKDASALKENTDAEAPLSRLSDDNRSSSSSIAISLGSESPSPPSSPCQLPEDKSNEYERSWPLGLSTSYDSNSPRSVILNDIAHYGSSEALESSSEKDIESPSDEPKLQASYIPRINTRTYRAIDPPRRYQSEVTTVDRKSDVCEDTAAGRFGTLGAAPDSAPSRSIHAIEKFTFLYAKTPADYIQDRNIIKEATAQDINVINSVSLSASPTLVERNGIVVESSSTNPQTSTSQI